MDWNTHFPRRVVMLTDALHQAYNRTRWALLVRGLIAIALGCFIFARPLESAAAFALLIAIWALVTGIIQIVNGVELRSVLPHWWLLLVGGLVSVAFGIAALYYYPVLSLTFAVVWASYWLLLSGFVGIYEALHERRMGVPWAWTLAFGVLSALAGLYAIVVPPVTLAVIMGLMAGFALVGGIVLLIGFFKLTSARERLTSAADTIRA
jgi:uncharacterized membrane protein HdeD (DUF308 family)